MTVGGSAVGVPIGTPGQNGTLTVTGAASQQVTVHVTGNTFGWVTLTLLGTDGTTVLTQSQSYFSSFNLATVTLPSAGTYTIVVDPYKDAVGTASISVTSP